MAAAERTDLDADAGGASPDVSRNAAKIRSGSWSATSRQLILAWAWAGMIVLLPSPWKPPQMPLTSSVGRARGVRGSSSRPRRGARAGRAGQVGGLVERQLGDRLASSSRQLSDVVVEARHVDAAVRALERRR